VCVAEQSDDDGIELRDLRDRNRVSVIVRWRMRLADKDVRDAMKDDQRREQMTIIRR
jgi:hypothetical protein